MFSQVIDKNFGRIWANSAPVLEFKVANRIIGKPIRFILDLLLLYSFVCLLNKITQIIAIPLNHPNIVLNTWILQSTIRPQACQYWPSFWITTFKSLISLFIFVNDFKKRIKDCRSLLNCMCFYSTHIVIILHLVQKSWPNSQWLVSIRYHLFLWQLWPVQTYWGLDRHLKIVDILSYTCVKSVSKERFY